ncbi:MAG TPA: hypothetical protein VI111_08860, partial [Thermoleophilaceae bacterium]
RRFDPAFRRLRREDWEWGFRLLAGGGELRYEPSAVAAHEYELSAGARIRACRLEGGGDALLLTRHAGAAPFLPLALLRPDSWRHPLRRAAALALGHPRADPFVRRLLDLLERGRLRGSWSALYRRAQRAAYTHGLRTAGWRPGRLPSPPLLEVELASDAPLPRPNVVLPRVRVLDAGRPVAELQPRDGWHPRLARELGAQLAANLILDEHQPTPAPLLRTSVTVLLGPARAPGDDRQQAALTAAGANVEVLAGPAARLGQNVEVLAGSATAHWEQIVDAARRARTELIAVPFPGRTPEPVWLAQAAVAFEAPHVLLTVGQGMPRSWPIDPVTLHDRGRGRVPFAPLGGTADYLLLRRSALPQLERAASRAAYGPLAVAFACAEEVLAAGGLVAQRNTHGLDPTSGAWPAAAEREQAKLTAWGALLADRACDQPTLRGVGWLTGLTAGGLALGALRRMRGGPPSPVSQMATGRALLRGYAAAIRHRDRTGRR